MGSGVKIVENDKEQGVRGGGAPARGEYTLLQANSARWQARRRGYLDWHARAPSISEIII